jgi:NTP pyrophosphatase (non-canonical NTP hydrolase)
MKFEDIVSRAIEIREKYSAYEKDKVGKVWNNEQIAEGFVGDVGDLVKLVMAKEGYREIEGVNEKLKHELVDCLWSIIVLAHRYGIDLQGAFIETMDHLESKLDNK